MTEACFAVQRGRRKGGIFGSSILFQAGITVVTSMLSQLCYIP